MINLLPPDKKRQIRAGQSNALLLRYCILSLLLAALLFALIGGVYIMMDTTKRTAEETIQESNHRSAEYQPAQQELTEFNNNLATAKAILDKEVRYSELAVKIAQSLPSGIVLESLNLDSKTFGQPMTLSALGKTYDDSLRLKSSLEDSPYFENVHLQSVSIGSDGPEGGTASITINVTIKPEIAKNE